MRFHLQTLCLLIFFYPCILLSQQNTQKKQPLSEEEQWKRDSVELVEKYQKKRIQDSIKWTKFYSERRNPKDSLSHIDKKTKERHATGNFRLYRSNEKKDRFLKGD